MKTAGSFLVLIFLVLSPVHGQLFESGNLMQRMDKILAQIPGADEDQYSDPLLENLITWEAILDNIRSGDVQTASQICSQIEYQLVLFDSEHGPKNKYYILEPIEGGSNHWGFFVFNLDAKRDFLHLQVPHPKYDLNTGQQGMFVFEMLEAASLFIAGTHRCNSLTSSTCSGSTSACGSNDAFRISDMAHNVKSIFHFTTSYLEEKLEHAIFVQFHGFGKTAGDPDLIVSNGTRLTPADDPIERLVNSLSEKDPSVSWKIGHQDLDWDRLLAFTNTQGRLLNNSIDPCTQGATSVSGQFIHLEQSLLKFRNDETGWQLMGEAIGEALPIDAGTITGLGMTEPGQEIQYTNPFENSLLIRLPGYPETAIFTILNLNGQVLLKQKFEDSVLLKRNESFVPGLYILRIDFNNGLVINKKLLVI